MLSLLKKLPAVLGLALVCAVPVWAEDAAVEAEVTVEPAVEAVAVDAPAAEVPEDTAAMADEQPAAHSNQDVWWGNRSIAFGNYIKFDKSTAVRKPCIHGCYEPCGSCPECHEPMIFDKIFFDLDKSVLRPAGKEECERVIAYMNAHPEIDVIVQGHCCDLAPDAYNLALGQRRADSVKRYLVEHGISSSRIATRTYGEREPWQPVEHRELNRRAIVIVVNK